MNNRVLFIGSSQIGSIKLAHDQTPDLLSGWDIDFMAFNQQWARFFDMVDGILRPTGEAAEEVRVQGVQEPHILRYRAIVVIGMGMTSLLMGSIYQTHRLLMHFREGFQLLSRPAFDAATADAILASGMVHIVQKLRSVTQAPILAVPDPLLSAAIVEDEDWADVWTGPHVPFLLEQYFERLHKHVGPLADLLGPPPEAVVGHAFTHIDYSRGGVRMEPRSRRGDIRRYDEARRDRRHMNEEYGRLICRDICSWLTQKLGP